MTVLLDGRGFIIDESATPFIHDRALDLVAAQDAGTPYFPGQPEILIFDYPAEKSQVLVVKAIIPYALQRVDVGLDTEHLEFIPQRLGNMAFQFTPYIGPGAIGLVDFKYPPLNSAAAAANEPSESSKGFTTISEEPKQDAERAWFNPMTTYALVPPGQPFRVTFKLIPTTLGGGFYIPPKVIPGPDPNANKQRVDWAGCYVVGMQMSQQAYSEMVDDMKKHRRRKTETYDVVNKLWTWVQRKWG